MREMMIAILSGGVVVAIIEGIRECLSWHRERRARKEDRQEELVQYEKRTEELRTEERLENIENKVNAQNEALKYILYDRIRHLGQTYIVEGEIDFDDRRILNDMHRSYHSGLGGNGDLDVLMRDVNELPLKKPR